ncbi:tetratricopeptide repeat protein [Methylomarinum vadi]|uniref:tetratricopeptide repeat protein n=1 Tax=Methylomarinum vadi TaxID=438855 RepID=UPI0004DEDBEF|nr:tetratricopeptide repeat protein [Methylomarinum vadi]
MKTKSKQLQQPSPAELQSLHQLFQAGRLQQAETMARSLQSRYRKAPVLYNIIGLCQQGQGQYREALSSFRKLIALDPRIAEGHFNLALLYTEMDNIKEAIFSYRKTLRLKPDLTAAHYNLAALLQAQGLLEEAAGHYRKAVELNPTFFEALGNLGTVLQQQGLLKQAEEYYRRALALNADARGYFNLGTVLYGLGQHQEAIEAFQEAIKLDPEFADAWNSMGETRRDQGQMDEAVRCYRKAITLQPKHSRARYNMGEYLYLADRLDEAVAYFDSSDFADSRERALQCLYKSKQFEPFKQRLDSLTANSRHTSVMLGTLATHYATNFHQPITYRFCSSPMEYVRHTRIDELADPDSPLLQELLHDIQHLAIAERKQGRLYYGIQSAGNLLLRSEPSFQKLAKLIKQKIAQYRQHYAKNNDYLISDFPRQIEFTSSWYLRMKQGGYLTSHIHEEGWISGCVYLKLPKRTHNHEGSFAYSTDGDDYPRLHDDFPEEIVDVEVGDLVLFPSSLFHRTLPFQSDEERVCVAFDVKPA